MSFAANPPSFPPRFVPTLTEVVPEADEMSPAQTNASAPQSLLFVQEEEIVHRVLQRVDMALEQRLREAIATVVHEQTRSLLPRLREEVESVLRQTVYEAVAAELAEGRVERG
ncbi:hypothetical protein [Extensimonas vulgaris]|jgi:hypothetical protein|uniref:DUF2486 family protein n=1 Tax=Extensimonas vulgaris TaxID=1031594 RepID=A0A369AU10_9BURK|nr:hypothetical protein [Extensimonas vulgaris]RCX11828.1 hypothetical protein DFR45_101359 [Extensimonas vulgaris]TWI40721.1 hypothetical protein IP95_00912 [Extensimonas vulgaris]TXD15333.1 hypothetical protein FUT63_07435 [Extensimonas vulgaris]